MGDTYEIQKGIPIPPAGKFKTGLTDTLRKMASGDSIVVPNSKRGSVYACATQAGVRVQTQANSDGASITVWCLSPSSHVPKPGPAVAGPGYAAADTGPTVTLSALWSQITTPDGDLPTGRYVQDGPYGSNVWRPDLDERGRPVNLSKNKAAAEAPTIFD